MTAFSLKVVAIVSMLIDHIGAVFSTYTPITLRWVGRIAFPIFAFMIAQGCKHTKNIYKYLARLGVLAIISEVFFDLAFNSRMTIKGVFEPGIHFLVRTNVFYTLFLGVACIVIYEGLKTKTRPGWSYLPFLCIPMAFMLSFVPYLSTILMMAYTAGALCLSHFLPNKAEIEPTAVKHKIIPFLTALPVLLTADALSTDFGALGVGLIFFLYLGNPDNKVSRAVILTAGMIWLYGRNLFAGVGSFVDGQLGGWAINYNRLGILLFALLAVILVSFYNGKQGRKVKWAFYVFYPAHLALLTAMWYFFVGV